MLQRPARILRLAFPAISVISGRALSCWFCIGFLFVAATKPISAQKLTGRSIPSKFNAPPEPEIARHYCRFPASEASDSALALIGANSIADPPAIVELRLERGTPIRVMVMKALPVGKVGQPIRAFVSEPVYAFDRIVVPQGSEVDGHITLLKSPSPLRKTAAYLDADFSPHRAVTVEFDTLILPNGSRLPLHTRMLADAGPVKLETNPSNDCVARRAHGLVSRAWRAATAQIKPSVLWRHAKVFAESEWPYRRQKIAAGSVFVAELESSIDFGPALIPAAEMGSMGQLPTENTYAFARLITPLSSATSHAGAPVEALLTRPVFSPQKKLLLPVNAELQGTVVRVRPARSLRRNGQLHFKLSRVRLPSGPSQPVEMALEGLEVVRSSHIQVDSEGATHVAGNAKFRVLSTALSVAIADATLEQDRDHGVTDPAGHAGNRAIAGGSGYKLVGFALSLGIKSRAFSQGMGFWGAGESVYFHLIARGQNLVLPMDTPMEISFGGPRGHAISSPSESVAKLQHSTTGNGLK